MLDGKKIKARRKLLGLKLKDAADAAGFSSPQAWANIENAKTPRDVQLNTLLAMARALQCSIIDLITIEQPKKKRKGEK